MAESSTDLFAMTQGLAPGEFMPLGVGQLDVPDDCLLASLGITPTHVGRGACRGTMKVGRGHLNQRGIAQGGAVVAFADAVAGWASYAAVETGKFTTADLTCHMLRTVNDGDELVARAEPVHLGRRMLVLDVVVTRSIEEETAAARPVARVTCTQLVLE